MTKKEIHILFPENDKGYIYHLKDEKNNIVYIGQTRNIYDRIGSHISLGKKFHSCVFWEVNLSEINEIECDEILTHWPPLNQSIPKNLKYCSLESFRRLYPVLKGKLPRIKSILRELEIKEKNGHYLISDLNKMLNIFTEFKND